MAARENPFPPAHAPLPVPTVAEVQHIASLTEPVLRNLLITQCYCELSAAVAQRTGPVANWCTFATWASKQAGQTIRREDLRRTLETLLKEEPEIGEALTLITTVARQLGTRQSGEHIRQSALGHLMAATADRAGNAVSRGNKKVFEEIAYQFARFIATCFGDKAYHQKHIEGFCGELRPGAPPDGQQYLRQAFTRYYTSLFETDPQQRTELLLLANLEIGFHEQTRLQPEIAESLNAAAAIDPQQVKTHLLRVLFPETDYRSRSRLFFLRLLGKTALLDRAVEAFVLRVQYHLRRVLTAHLMTLTLPPDRRLRLGQDLAAAFPSSLQALANTDLLALLKGIDPTPDSRHESGATDWAHLPERLHFIADLFRCHHQTKELFEAAFLAEQVAAMKEGRLPEGRL